MSPSCPAWPRAPYQAHWLGGYSPVVNVLSHDRHLTRLGPCRHGDASGVAFLSDNSPFSVGYGLPRTLQPVENPFAPFYAPGSEAENTVFVVFWSCIWPLLDATRPNNDFFNTLTPSAQPDGSYDCTRAPMFSPLPRESPTVRAAARSAARVCRRQGWRGR